MATKQKADRSAVRRLQLHISLLDVMPLVWRSVIVPETITLAKLHVVILKAMGWQGGQLHEFAFMGRRFGEPDHEWDETDDVKPERRVTLHKALVGVTSIFEYLYDFGDNWRHLVQVEEIAQVGPEALKQARCVAGVTPARQRTLAAFPATKSSFAHWLTPAMRSMGNS